MRRRKKQNHHDTTEEPDIDLYVDQPHIVPCHADEEANWTLNLMTRESANGDIGGNAVAVGAYAERELPGIIPGHLYKVHIDGISTLDDLVITLGGVHVFTIQSGQNHADVQKLIRPAGTVLKFSHDAGTNFTGAVTRFALEAMDPIDIDRIEIKEFGT